MFGLYIHIPFCRQICHYCDFYKMVVSDNLKEKVINSIIDEFNLRDVRNLNVETIYIGGGTPSSLPYYALELLLETITNNLSMNKIKEFTIELNPEDINERFVKLINKYQINRVSIGIQSFNKTVLKRLGRIPYISEEEIKEKIKILNNYGIKNISLDLIYAVPGEIMENLKKDLEIITNLNITHISTYSLILEEHTVLNYLYQKKQFELVDDQLDAKMYDYIKTYLCEKEFIQYEVSNFAKEGYRSLHNINYWLNGEYIGLGPSASSHVNNKRFTNIKKLNLYLEGIKMNKFKYDEFLTLENDEIVEEAVMLGLRLIDGINLSEFASRYNVNLLEYFPKLDSLVDSGLLEINNNNIYIPKKHTYISNYILVKLFE